MPRFTLVALAAVFLAGCSDPAPTEDPHGAQIAKLTRAVEDLTASHEALEKDVRRQGRQLSGLSRDSIARFHPSGVAEAENEAVAQAHGAGTAHDTMEAVATPENEGEPVAEGAMDAMLATEAGQKAIQHATAKEIERREAKERRLYVSYQVGRFARAAGLDDRQTEELQRIWKTSLDGGVELRKEFAAIGTLPEAERKDARAKAMESMRGLGKTRRDSVREILNDEQLELYGKAEEEIVGSLHGGSRR